MQAAFFLKFRILTEKCVFAYDLISFPRVTFFLRSKKYGACGTAALGAAVTFAPDWQGTFLRCWQPREITRFAGLADGQAALRETLYFTAGSGRAERSDPPCCAATHADDCQHARQMLVDAPRSPQRGDGRGEKEKDPPTDEIISQRVFAHTPLNHCITQCSRCQEESPRAGEGRGDFLSVGRSAR